MKFSCRDSRFVCNWIDIVCGNLISIIIQLSREEQVQGSLALPEDLQAVEIKVHNVSSRIDAILRDISTLICQKLDPPISTKVVDNPRSTGMSNLCLGISAAKAGTQVMGEHLDEDLLTLTFYDEPFLEVLDRQTQTWKLVDVLEHLPIVNVGDRFRSFSDGRLHAPLHRVKQTPNQIDLIMYDLDASIQQVY
jgi:isopenicillin N synthase-like dioxygenase